MLRKQFAVSSVRAIEENSKSQFATLDVDIARSGYNTHRMPMSRDAIKNAVVSVKDKPILAAFNGDESDFMGHEYDEVPVGMFTDEIETVEKGGELFLNAKAKIWKRYFPNVMEIFNKKNGETEVSCEIEVLEGTEPTPTAEGSIDLMSLMGCTLLGVKPAIKGAKATVLSFAEMQDEYIKESEGIGRFSDSEEVNVETKEEESMAEKEKDVIEEVEMSESEVVEEEAVEEMADELAVEETETEEMADTEEMEDEPTDDEQPDEPEQEEEMAEEDTTEEMEETVAESFVSKLSRVCDCAYTERCGCIDGMEFAEEEGIVMSKLYGIFERHCELEAFYEKTLAEQTKFAVSEVLASVKTKLSAEDYKTVEEMSENVKFEEIDIFRNKVKAFAFDKMIPETKKEEDGIIKMGAPRRKEEKETNVFKRILGK